MAEVPSAPPLPPAASFAAEARAFVALALPMVVSRIGVAGFGLADGWMLARHSAQQLAVNGLAESLMGRLLEVAMMVATAGLALVAQARAGGPAQQRGVGVVWHNAIALALLMGAVGMGLGGAGGALLQALGQPPALLPDASRVLLILGAGAAPALLGLVCAGVLEALGRPVGVAVAVVGANALNVALNQWFIHGGAGLPAMGAQGAAWSTLLVRSALAAALFAALWWGPGREVFGLRQRFDAAAWRQGAELRQRGLSGAANVGVLALLSLGLPVMAGWLGADAVAQVTALFLALAPAMVLAWGLGDAAGLRVAAQRGAAPAESTLKGPLEGTKGAGLQATGLRLALLLAALLGLAVLAYAAAPRAAVALAAHDPALVAAVLPLLPLGLVALVGDAASVFFAAMLRSLGALRGPFLAHLGAGMLVLPLAWGLGFAAGLGLSGLLMAHGAAALLRAVALAVMFRRAAREADAAAPGAPA